MRAALVAPTLVLSLAAAAAADVHLVPDPDGPLAGKTIVVSPGHGYMPENGAYRWQRGVTHGLREDVHTNEIVIEHLQRLLGHGHRGIDQAGLVGAGGVRGGPGGPSASTSSSPSTEW